MNDEFEVRYQPHDLVRIRRRDGDYVEVTRCMIDRVDSDEIIDGTMPPDTPVFEGMDSEAHTEWRGGCPYENE